MKSEVIWDKSKSSLSPSAEQFWSLLKQVKVKFHVIPDKLSQQSSSETHKWGFYQVKSQCSQFYFCDLILTCIQLSALLISLSSIDLISG